MLYVLPISIQNVDFATCTDKALGEENVFLQTKHVYFAAESLLFIAEQNNYNVCNNTLCERLYSYYYYTIQGINSDSTS